MKEKGKKLVSVSVLKARCLGLVDEVHKRGTEYVITKKGEPVARLVPLSKELPSPAGLWRGLVRVDGDIVRSDWSDEFVASRDD
jgi:prevent-host-death family protein